MVVTVPLSHHPGFYDDNARQYLLSLQSGQKPESKPDFGRWQSVVEVVERAFDRVESKGPITQKLLGNMIGSTKYPGLRELLAGKATNLRLVETEPDRETAFPHLPEYAQIAPGLATGACPPLDTYVAFSREASPEAWDDFHVFCGLSLLSTINARRSYVQLRRKRVHGNLMIAMCADSSMFAKSTTADVAKDVLREIGLAHLMGPSRITPAKLLSDMSGQFLPTNYPETTPDRQELIRQRLSMSGQKGLYFDEFGKFVQAMLRKGSTMADFADLFLEFDACPGEYENATIARGGEPIMQPYLSLLGSMTPANIKDHAKTGSDFWIDGFWARFSFVVAPPATIETIKDEALDDEELPIPPALLADLEEWHERLGVPECELEAQYDEKKEKPTGKYIIHRGNLPETSVTFTNEAKTAWKAYRSALKRLCITFPHKDMHASYARLPETALRIAILLASLSNNNVIDLRIWAKAQELAEILRKNLHELYAQVNAEEINQTFTSTIEDRIQAKVKEFCAKGTPPSLRDLSRYIKGPSSGMLRTAVNDLVRIGWLEEQKSGKTTRYTPGAPDDS